MSAESRRVFILILGFIFLITACGQRDDDPPPVPTSTISPAPTAIPTEAAVEPTDMPPTPTAEPEVVVPVETIDWAPQVVYSSPAPGESVLLDGAITVRFDQPMDEAAVAQALTVFTGNGVVRGELMWPRPDTLVFAPADSLASNEALTLTVSDAAKGVNGKQLLESISLDFVTAGFLQVSDVVPSEGNESVSAEPPITFFFNKPVVPLSGTGQQEGLVVPLEIDPPIEGEGEWISTSIYRFEPSEQLAPATTYTLRTTSDLTDIVGVGLEQPFESTFTTAPPTLIQTLPIADDRPLDVTPTISMTFNVPMNQAATEGAIVIAPAADLAFNWSEDGKTVGLTPVGALSLETVYLISVSAEASAENGGAALENAEPYTFRTYPFPKISGSSPENGDLVSAEIAFYQSGANIWFESPMDVESLESGITVLPNPETLEINANEFGVFVEFPLEFEAGYEVIVSGSVTDIYGNPLGEDVSISFTTGPALPVSTINLPSGLSQISTAFPSEVSVLHRKVEGLTLRLYDFDGQVPIQQLNQFDIAFLVEAEPTGLLREWQIEPADSNELTSTSIALADGGALPNGIYFVELDSPLEQEFSLVVQKTAAFLTVADTNLAIKETPENIYVWATDLATGAATGNRELTFYATDSNENVVPFATATTDADGFATVSKDQMPAENEFYQYGYTSEIFVVSNRPNSEGFGYATTQRSQYVEGYQLGIAQIAGPEVDESIYIYTERPLYRAGDTVYIRGWLRTNNYGRYNVPTPGLVELDIFNINTGSTPTRLELTLDENGGFYGEFVLTEDAPLGTYQISSNIVNYSGRSFHEFTVAEFRKPEFLVDVTPQIEAGVRGDEAVFEISAEFFFGGPVADQTVSWIVRSDTYMPPFTDGPPYYNFTEQSLDFGFFSGGFSEAQVTSGEGMTNEDGKLLVQLPADILDSLDAGSRTLNLEATVVDSTGFAVSGRGEMIHHVAETYVGIVRSAYATPANTPAAVDLITVDWDNQFVANVPVEVVFSEIEWESFTDANGLGTEWRAITTEVARVQTTTDQFGNGSASFTPESGGNYIAEASALDSNGRMHSSSTMLWVYSGSNGWRFDANDPTIELQADKTSYAIGDNAQILVQSPFVGPVQAWLTVERGEIIEQRLITLGSSSEIITIPITEVYAPNIFVTLTMVKGVDESDFPYPALRTGAVDLAVETTQRELTVDITPSSNLLEPRDSVTYDILVTDSAGNGVEADVALALVDLAILTLKEDTTPGLLEIFYRPQPLRSRIASGLLASGDGRTVDDIRYFVGGRGGGGGGFAEGLNSVALDEADSADIRSDFRDTAHWEARIVTDADGRASITIELPDNLTTWRLLAKAVSAETLVGEAETDIIATKKLIVRPVTPRFFTVGDEVLLGAVVNNNSLEPLEASVTLEATGVNLVDGATQTVMIDPGSSQLVRWPATIMDAESVDLTFSATAGDLSDATKPTVNSDDGTIPIIRYEAQDTVATAGVLVDEARRVEAVLLPPLVNQTAGGLDLRLNASLAATVVESFDVFSTDQFANRCPYAIANHLLPNAIMAAAIAELDLGLNDLLSELNTTIPQQIAELESQQRSDRGWAWCRSEQSHPLTTAHALLALARAQQAGYEVSEIGIDRARVWLRGQLESDINTTGEANYQALAVYVLAIAGDGRSGDIDALLENGRDLLDPYAFGLLAQAALAVDGAAPVANLLDELKGKAIASATGVHWQVDSADSINWNSDTRSTAIAISTLAQTDPDSELARGAVRWLMTARNGERWPTSIDTAWSLTALTDWLVATDELNADFDYAINVNGVPSTQGQFDQSMLGETVQNTIPLTDLQLDEVNFLDIRKDGGGSLYYTAQVDAFVSAESVQAVDRGFQIERVYYDAACDPAETVCEPIESIEVGQQVRVELTVVVANNWRYATISDAFPSGTDAIDPNLDTSATGQGAGVAPLDAPFSRGYWGWWYFNDVTFYDERVVFSAEFLPAGSYQYTYFLQATVPGTFQVIPTVGQLEFRSEIFGRSNGMLFTISEP